MVSTKLGHFGWLKISFDRISHYFGSICKLFSPQNDPRWPFWQKITFDHISRHFRTINNFCFSHKNGIGVFAHFEWPKITFDRISRHFRSIHNFVILFTKWLPATILDDWKSLSIACLSISDQYATLIKIFFTKLLSAPILDYRKSLSIAFLAISDQYATFLYFFSQNGRRWPFWRSENHFRSHFSPFQINTQFLFLFFFTKWLPAAILDDRKSLLIAFLSISYQYASFFSHKIAAGGHFGCPKITFLRISCHFRSIHNFFFSKWPLAAILEVRFGPFCMTENHFQLHFWPFQINTQLLLFMPPGTIVPMGAYCFYCVRMYVCMYVCMSEFG